MENTRPGRTGAAPGAQVAQNEALVRGDQAQIDTARTQLGYATIVAPNDGRVGLRQVDVWGPEEEHADRVVMRSGEWLA